MDRRAHGKVQQDIVAWFGRSYASDRQDSLRQESEGVSDRNTQPKRHHSGQRDIGTRRCSLHTGV